MAPVNEIVGLAPFKAARGDGKSHSPARIQAEVEPLGSRYL
jgi:hypothetical protein